jgi:predicted nuclease of predicted toxin-antitoxin system
LKLLLDFILSPKLLPLVARLFHGSSHVLATGLPRDVPDEAIWKYAKENRFTILTADRDFFDLAARFGPPPKVIRLENMNYRTKGAGEVIQQNAPRITEFDSTGSAILVLRAERR